MKIRRRIKRTTRQYIIVALICIIVIGGAAVFTSILITNQVKEEYRQLLNEANKDKAKNQRTVYIAVADIKTGDFITADNVEKKTVYASQPKDLYIKADDLGKAAMVDIPAGTQLQKNMITGNTVAPELREAEFNVILTNSNIVNNDYVDVRIMYPNGESYVVLAKKVIKGFDSETNTCFFWLDEAEILRTDAAIVDAALYPGTKLYTTKYIEPALQEASVVTYTPSLSILSMMESNPNIVVRLSQKLNKEIRKSLENRLAASLETDISKVSWDVSGDKYPGDAAAQNSESPAADVSPAPSPSPDPVLGNSNEQPGSPDSYLYYAQEAEDKENVTEYGE